MYPLIFICILTIIATSYIIYTNEGHKTVTTQKIDIPESKIAICFHFCNVERVKSIIEMYPTYFSEHYMVGTTIREVVDMESEHWNEIKPYFQEIIFVENTGLDFGGFFAGVKKIPETFTHVMKVHDKKDLDWLTRLMDPLVFSKEDKVATDMLVSSTRQIHPFRPDININIYWTHLICEKLSIPMPINFSAGSMFVAPISKVKRFIQLLIENNLMFLNNTNTYDPSWVAYYYQYVANDPDFKVWQSSDIVQDTIGFRTEMESKKCIYNNGHHYVLETGNLYTNTGASSRDSMFEHALERVLGTFCSMG